MPHKTKGEKKGRAQRLDRDPKTGRFKTPTPPPAPLPDWYLKPGAPGQSAAFLAEPSHVLEVPKAIIIRDARDV